MNYATNRNKMVITLSGIVGFFLAIAPVLDPYVFAEFGGITIKLNDIAMLFLSFLCFAKSTRFDNRTNFLCLLIVILTFISTLGNLGSDTDVAMSAKNLIVWFVFALCVSYIWKVDCRKRFFYWLEIIAIFATILIIIQFVFGNLGLPMWDGRIPGLPLGKYDGWAGYIDKNTGDIRPNGIFQEASYVGIYMAVAYAQAFKDGKIKRMFLYALAMLLTSSMIAVILCLSITLYLLIKSKKIDVSSKTTKRVILAISVAVIALIILIQTNESVGETFAYIMKRFNNLGSDLKGDRMSSTKYRILGHIDLFQNYNGFQKFVGVGAGQYSSYWGVSSYSNVIVSTILNFGIAGLITLAAVILKIAKVTERKNRVYLLILVLVLASDYQWFSWYFFYLISACVLIERTDPIQDDIVK